MKKREDKKMPSICFVAPTAFPVLANDPTLSVVGGAELQQTILARALAKSGYKVSMICMHHGQQDKVIIDGVTVYRAYKPTAGIPILRFIHPRLTSIWSCMKDCNADIFYQRSAGMLTGIVAKFCQTYKKKSIYAAASNDDFLKNCPKIKYRRDSILFEYGLKNVDQIVTQNQHQQTLLKDNYGRKSRLIRNVYAPPSNFTNNKDGYILWVSNIRTVKQPQLILELARHLPQYQFKMIGGSSLGEEPLYREIENKAAELHNLEFIGFVPIMEVENYFDKARIVVNTSSTEGFPNTFLQAWSRMIPTISFVDCGARSSDGSLIGDCINTPTEMQTATVKLMQDDQLWLSKGSQANAYYLKNHSIDSATSSLKKLFECI